MQTLRPSGAPVKSKLLGDIGPHPHPNFIEVSRQATFDGRNREMERAGEAEINVAPHPPSRQIEPVFA
jgi:hypothetical protein